MRYSSKPVEPESGLQNFGYRFYSSQLGRWLSRDPMQERGGVNLYGYVHNSPVGSFDVLGLWGSVPGLRVHQNVTESELDALSKYEIALISAAHVYIDQDQFQTARFSFMHAMRSPEDSVACGAQKTNNFIRNQLLFARAHLQEGDRVRALWRFGFALHTLQDASSPSHAGFQVWSGHEELWEKALHVVQEGHPVQAWGTSLARDTRRAFGILMGNDPFPERFFGADGKPENE